MSAEQAGGTPGPGAMSERMRALLARAAEEQLVEQRQVSSVLGELRTLVADLDERLASGEQVERVAAEVRALSARVEGRLDAADARSAELAERVGAATALLEQAAQDLASAERRLATHVDDAVLALAEVVLRRRRPVAPVPPDPAPPDPEPVADVTPEPEAAARALEDLPPGPPAEPSVEDRPGPPGEGFVLVPADVEEPDTAPAAPVQHERRTADRRTAERSDGSGRRRRPWWRAV